MCCLLIASAIIITTFIDDTESYFLFPWKFYKLKAIPFALKAKKVGVFGGAKLIGAKKLGGLKLLKFGAFG